jgi:uncharacterized protein
MVLGLVVLMQAPSAEARGRIGTDEELRSVLETKIQKAGRKLWLARKIRTENFMLPYMVVDDGYVLSESFNSYIALDEAAIKEYQAQGLLPNPLPPFKLQLGDYAWGYSLWILLAGVAAWSGISALWNRRKAEPA